MTAMVKCAVPACPTLILDEWIRTGRGSTICGSCRKQRSARKRFNRPEGV